MPLLHREICKECAERPGQVIIDGQCVCIRCARGSEVRPDALDEAVEIEISIAAFHSEKQPEQLSLTVLPYQPISIAPSPATRARKIAALAEPLPRALRGNKNGQRLGFALREIQRVTETYFASPYGELLTHTASRKVAIARQIAMFLSRRTTTQSLPAIGRFYGHHHTTVLYAVERIEALLSTDSDVRDDVLNIFNKLKKTNRSAA